MKILINMKLGYSKVDSKLRPIAQLECIDKIFVVRDKPGPRLPKVEYHCPPRLISRIAILCAICKLFILIYLSLFRKPDLIHSYLLFPHGTLAFIAAKLTKRPIGISLIAGRAELYEMLERPSIDFTQPIPWFGKVYLKMFNHCDVITVTGSVTRDFLIDYGVKEKRIHILHHSAAKHIYYPEDVPKEYDIISVAKMDYLKHIKVTIKASAKVKEELGDISVAIIGEGPCRAKLEKLSAQLGICDDVEFLGFQEDITHYYNSSKIFVLTSEREGFPSTFIEAMMCGIPSIVSNCGDIIDIARDGFNAIVIQNYNDVDGFAEAITRLLEDKKLYRRLSNNALETAKELSNERVAQEWELILDRIAR